MKLLIADDEKLTREGIISSIDWTSLGVSEIYQADDGIHGLELAKNIQPDIVLSDVRMPRMDGIKMSCRLKELFPNISIIFMSGYSDKEYLKAAIKLKAISYVEKPIDPKEIRESVLEALKNKQQLKETTDTKEEHLRFAASSLATRLIYPDAANESDFSIDFKKLSFDITDQTIFRTIILAFKDSLSKTSEHALTSFYAKLHDFLATYGLFEIHGVKQERYLIYHIFGADPSYENLKTISATATKMAAVLSNDFFIAVGKRVNGAEKIYDSYNTAVIQLQRSFYYPYGSFFIEESPHPDLTATLPPSFSIDKFRNSLNQRNPKVIENAKEIYEHLVSHKNVMATLVKDLYYQMFSSIQEAYHVLQVQLPNQKTDISKSLDNFFNCETIFELNQLLVHELNLFFTQAGFSREDSSPVNAIKSFIASHYDDETLSIKDISDHVFLSTSYICTIFKNETGQTLNQYITKYRIGRAKKLLADPRNKISDISSKVGYSDGNYFGKTFKKIVGLSPTEYRDQVTNL